MFDYRFQNVLAEGARAVLLEMENALKGTLPGFGVSGN